MWVVTFINRKSALVAGANCPGRAAGGSNAVTLIATVGIHHIAKRSGVALINTYVIRTVNAGTNRIILAGSRVIRTIVRARGVIFTTCAAANTIAATV